MRLMQVVVPEVDRLDLEGILEGSDIVSTWQQARSGDRIAVNLVVRAEEAEPIMDRVESRFASVHGFRLLLYPLEAVLPRPPKEATLSPSAEDVIETVPRVNRSRVSREELYGNIMESLGSTRTFLVMIALSVVVAAVGLLRDELAVIIAAMVIAPLLAPNVALALATTLGDSELATIALRRATLGLVVGLVLSIAIGGVHQAGVFSTPTELLEVPAIVSRTQVLPSDVALALAAGVAGTLAFTSGASATLIGVMVAVALMPPLVVFGLLLAAGSPGAWQAGLLVATNLVCVNAAGVATFLFQGVRPREWWHALRAAKTSRWGLVAWLMVLAVLTLLVVLNSPVLAGG